MPGVLQLPEIGLPVFRLIPAQRIQRIPGIDAGLVAVVKHRLDGVIADRLDALDVDVLLADLQHALAGPMPLHLRRRRMNPQVFATHLKRFAVIKRHRQGAGFSIEFDFGGGVLAHYKVDTK